MSFFDKLSQASENNDSLVCVGLDTDIRKLPVHLSGRDDAFITFNKDIIEATADLVCAYKPNSAFYEALGAHGIDLLIETCAAIPGEIPVILDVKRGDIGNTASKYADYSYDIVGADAVTVNPYMGFDAVKPFLRDGKCVFVLCLTSNPSSADFQLDDSGKPLFVKIAEKAVEWSREGEVGLVVGATQPEHMTRIRDIAADLPFLIPGIGAQGGDIDAVISRCGAEAGKSVINSSRGILYASSEEDYAVKARESLLSLRNEINVRRNAT